MMSRAVLEEMGFAEITGVLTTGQCADLAVEVAGADSRRPGSRNLLDLPSCEKLAATLRGHPEIAPLLPPRAVAVQCILFDKSEDKNWLVALHQDLSIPVQERISHPECAGWSEKEGVVYVQPPVAVLESLVAVRVNLDDCGPESGPLRVIPRSHRHGRLAADATKALRQQEGEIECVAGRGAALVMRPLLLHSSSKARAKSRRRVLHVLFGPTELACGLRWHRTV